VEFVVENNSSKKEMEVLIQEDLIKKNQHRPVAVLVKLENTVNKVTSRHSQMYWGVFLVAQMSRFTKQLQKK
jgi:hypothetical protein